jgi:hypothetical protein
MKTLGTAASRTTVSHLIGALRKNQKGFRGRWWWSLRRRRISSRESGMAMPVFVL